jgi:hypothetical protein
MARTVLGPRQATEFLGSLWGKSYIHRLLNLPYGLAVAMQCYREQQSIPLTDRELVSRVVEHRLVYDRRQHRSLQEPLADIPLGTVRRLAEAVAFHLRILRRSLYFSESDAGALMNEAIQELCSAQALGAERLDSVAALRLLEHYDFLVKGTNAGWVVVHDLVIDLLIAERLASAWRTYESELRSRVFDDAWVFAASRISGNERDEFLRTMLAVDVIRGARCAREIGYFGHVENDVLRYAKKAKLPYERWQAATASAIIGTERVSQFLHKLAGRSEDDPWHHQAVRALASMGDEDIINTALANWDERRCGPIKVSCWWDDVVRISHPAVLLRVARRRLQRHVMEQCLSTSIDVVAMYGGEEDVPSIVEAIRQTSSLTGLAEGLAALHGLAPAAAVNLARELLECPRQVHVVMAELLWHWNEPVPPDRLIGIVLEPEVPEELLAECMPAAQPKGVDESAFYGSQNPQKYAAVERQLRDPEFQRSLCEQDWLVQCHRATKLLGRLSLDNASQMRLRAAYDNAPPIVRNRIWNIATDHALPAFEAVADRRLNSGTSEENACAARYLMAFHSDSASLQPYLPRVEAEIRLIIAGQAPGGAMELDVMLHFYERASDPHAAARVLEQYLSKILNTISAGNVDSLLRSNQKWQLSSVLPSIFRLKHLLPRACLLQLFALLDMSSFEGAGEVADALLKEMGDAEIDEFLGTVVGVHGRAWLLMKAAAYGCTLVRRQILREVLAHPWLVSLDRYLAETLERLWNDEVAADVIATIVTRQTSEEVMQIETYSPKTVTVISQKLRMVHVVGIIHPILRRGGVNARIRALLEDLAAMVERRA